jgi:hypothetical protein
LEPVVAQVPVVVAPVLVEELVLVVVAELVA